LLKEHHQITCLVLDCMHDDNLNTTQTLEYTKDK
jgi:hypothetical protein